MNNNTFLTAQMLEARMIAEQTADFIARLRIHARRGEVRGVFQQLTALNLSDVRPLEEDEEDRALDANNAADRALMLPGLEMTWGQALDIHYANSQLLLWCERAGGAEAVAPVGYEYQAIGLSRPSTLR